MSGLAADLPDQFVVDGVATTGDGDLVTRALRFSRRCDSVSRETVESLGKTKLARQPLL